jgi:hypothetical protein
MATPIAASPRKSSGTATVRRLPSTRVTFLPAGRAAVQCG